MQNLFVSLLSLLSRLTGKKVIYINKEGIRDYAVKTSYGFWYVGNVFNYADIAYGFASNGKVEAFDMDLVENLVKKDSENKDYVFYDIGSNSGPYSLLAGSIPSVKEVHSFDPVDEHIETLKKSITLNRYEDKVKTHVIALSEKEGETILYLSGTGTTVEKDFIEIEGKEKRTVRLISLDTFIEKNNLPLPDFIKIDVEGHEYAVLKGATNTLKRKHPVLFIEIASNLENIGRDFTHKNFDTIFNMLTEHGYKSYVMENSSLKEYSTKEKTSGVEMYLFIPEEKASLVKVLVNTSK